ncbi:MAG: S-methyl-5-thioribose kinase [Actinomycetota bacterium]
MAEYRALDDTTILDYLREQPSVMAVLGEGDLTAEEMGDGNLNQVFIVRASGGGSLIVKQALPYLRVAGDDWPLTRERMRFEIAALHFHNEIAPERVPTVHLADEDMSLVAMDFLAEHEVMRGPLLRGERFPLFSGHISEFLATLHFTTSDMALTGEDKKALQRQFINPALCKIQEDFVYTNPYMESEENEWHEGITDVVMGLRSDWEIKAAIAEIKDTYMTRAQAMLHGDMHTGSIMVTADDTKCIDPEFAFFGPIGYDLGTLFANLAINWAAQPAHGGDASANQAEVASIIRDVWNGYAETFDRLWAAGNTGELVPEGYWAFDGGDAAFAEYRARYLRTILQDSAGHAGCEMLRRLMGIVTVPDLETIEDGDARSEAERHVHAVARRWLVDRGSIEDVDQFVAILTGG